MSKARIYGMNKTFVPKSVADRKRKKPFGVHKKGKKK